MSDSIKAAIIEAGAIKNGKKGVDIKYLKRFAHIVESDLEPVDGQDTVIRPVSGDLYGRIPDPRYYYAFSVYHAWNYSQGNAGTEAWMKEVIRRYKVTVEDTLDPLGFEYEPLGHSTQFRIPNKAKTSNKCYRIVFSSGLVYELFILNLNGQRYCIVKDTQTLLGVEPEDPAILDEAEQDFYKDYDSGGLEHALQRIDSDDVKKIAKSNPELADALGKLIRLVPKVLQNFNEHYDD